METLVALAITALVATALFQSRAFWFELSSKGARAAERSLAGIIDQRQFQQVVRGLIFAWPEQSDLAFIGGPNGFSGLSRRPLEAGVPRIALITLQIIETDAGSVLAYESDVESWTLQADLEDGASFSYLGADGVWRPSWPPAETPDPGDLGDGAYFSPPHTPLAVRIGFGPGKEAWIAAVGSAPNQPQRSRDVSEEF